LAGLRQVKNFRVADKLPLFSSVGLDLSSDILSLDRGQVMTPGEQGIFFAQYYYSIFVKGMQLTNKVIGDQA